MKNDHAQSGVSASGEDEPSGGISCEEYCRMVDPAAAAATCASYAEIAQRTQAWGALQREFPLFMKELKGGSFSAVERYVQALHREVRELEQALRYWHWLKEHQATLVYVPEEKQWKVGILEEGDIALRGPLRDTPEEAVQAAMDQEDAQKGPSSS